MRDVQNYEAGLCSVRREDELQKEGERLVLQVGSCGAGGLAAPPQLSTRASGSSFSKDWGWHPPPKELRP